MKGGGGFPFDEFSGPRVEAFEWVGRRDGIGKEGMDDRCMEMELQALIEMDANGQEKCYVTSSCGVEVD